MKIILSENSANMTFSIEFAFNHEVMSSHPQPSIDTKLNKVASDPNQIHWLTKNSYILKYININIS